MSIGIYDCFGYGAGYDVPFTERYRLIKEAGFDSVMLWWSERFGRGEGYREDAELARNAGLSIENMHAPVHEQNSLFAKSEEGENVFRDYLQCVEDCRTYRIPTIVIHLPDDEFPINDTGVERLGEIIGKASGYGVNVAFENLRNIRNLSYVMEHFPFTNVGVCYDSCHNANYSPGTDLTALYGNRLKALHLHDNGGIRNQHRLPFDGNIDWNTLAGRLKAVGYRGAITLEPMNWDYMDMGIRGFLTLAYEKARKLEQMIL
ncbi:MAG: sugar phosphate isomerase/epimerase [Ruminiclostridium sp.]|nr:sugar phosphate isomerase/epimerase [Ruminiclostridium sp.]